MTGYTNGSRSRDGRKRDGRNTHSPSGGRPHNPGHSTKGWHGRPTRPGRRGVTRTRWRWSITAVDALPPDRAGPAGSARRPTGAAGGGRGGSAGQAARRRDSAARPGHGGSVVCVLGQTRETGGAGPTRQHTVGPGLPPPPCQDRQPRRLPAHRRPRRRASGLTYPRRGRGPGPEPPALPTGAGLTGAVGAAAGAAAERAPAREPATAGAGLGGPQRTGARGTGRGQGWRRGTLRL